ncbi:MAG TPA: hypothetical protein ENN99_00800 [Chloroflexi bacterium]|nr:hypothetical protein [Chloroflexota bacterium]
MEDLDRAEERLANIRTVEPILGAMRTISMGSWQAALKQGQRIQQYEARLANLLPTLLPHLPPQGDRSSLPPGRYLPLAPLTAQERGQIERKIVVAIGTERGLVGRFNIIIAEQVKAYLDRESTAEVELAVLGGRLRRLLQQRGHSMTWLGALSVTALPTFERASELAQHWLAQYEAQELDQVDLLYNAYRGVDRYQPTVVRVIPPLLAATDIGNREVSLWPPPIIETDPLSLYIQVVQQQIALHLYRVMLDSAASEHSKRYQLMEVASQNVERLMDELMLVIQTARQQEITQEMQELAIGAGMLTRSKS